MIDGTTIDLIFDPIVREDGRLFYSEVLCRPQGLPCNTSVFNWILSKHCSGKSAHLDLVMAKLVVTALDLIDTRLGINLTPTGAVLYGDEFIDIFYASRHKLVIEIVEWDDTPQYTNPLFITFFKKAQDLGFYILLDDVGEGAFIDPILVLSLEGNGIKANFAQLDFARSVKTKNQELVVEFVSSINLVRQSSNSGATAFQGDHPRSLFSSAISVIN